MPLILIFKQTILRRRHFSFLGRFSLFSTEVPVQLSIIITHFLQKISTIWSDWVISVFDYAFYEIFISRLSLSCHFIANYWISHHFKTKCFGRLPRHVPSYSQNIYEPFFSFDDYFFHHTAFILHALSPPSITFRVEPPHIRIKVHSIGHFRHYSFYLYIFISLSLFLWPLVYYLLFHTIIIFLYFRFFSLNAIYFAILRPWFHTEQCSRHLLPTFHTDYLSAAHTTLTQKYLFHFK